MNPTPPFTTPRPLQPTKVSTSASTSPLRDHFESEKEDITHNLKSPINSYARQSPDKVRQLTIEFKNRLLKELLKHSTSDQSIEFFRIKVTDDKLITTNLAPDKRQTVSPDKTFNSLNIDTLKLITDYLSLNATSFLSQTCKSLDTQQTFYPKTSSDLSKLNRDDLKKILINYTTTNKLSTENTTKQNITRTHFTKLAHTILQEIQDNPFNHIYTTDTVLTLHDPISIDYKSDEIKEVERKIQDFLQYILRIIDIPPTPQGPPIPTFL